MTTETDPIVIDDDEIVVVPADGAEAGSDGGAATEAKAEPTLQEQLEAARKAAEDAAKAQAAAEARAEEEADKRRRAEEERQQANAGLADSRVATIAKAIEVEKAQINETKAFLKRAYEAGDLDGVSEAQYKLSEHATRMQRMNEGKAALESEIANARSAPRQADDPFEAYVSTLAPRAQDWLRSHRDLVTDEGKRSQLERAHYSALSDGIAPNTDAYYERLEERMGLRQRAPEPERRQPSQAATAAPVSRGATGGGSVTQVSLSAKEREAARFSGLSDAEYARQKLDLLRSGEIGNARH
ncbi:MAG: hypothetical protein J0I45_16330 [Bosea sp.]|nr:hypothetical protein [Bosea sp. (in: a-proteobacteria)]